MNAVHMIPQLARKKLSATRYLATAAERAGFAAGAAFGALFNPLRDDLIATLGETTGSDLLQRNSM